MTYSSALLHGLLLAALSGAVGGQSRAAEPDVSGLLPVAQAKDGFSTDFSQRLRQGFMWQTAYHTVDENLYYFLHWEQFVPHNLIRRGGPVRELASAPDPRIGRIRAHSSIGEMTLDDLLVDPRSRIQGFIVVHRGRIVYERYSGMREDDHHIWNSISKSVASLLVGLLEADGKIDVAKTIDAYLPELAGTHWQGIRVIDILDMATGLDLVESEAARNDVTTTFNKFWRLELGDRSGLDAVTADQILFSVAGKGEPGQVFEYSSMNTKMLGILIERVSGRRLAEFFSERVWSKMGAEGDAMVGVNLQGGAAIYGMVSSRLRDLARYGLLYSPSWKVVASQRVVPESLIDAIQTGCRPALYARSGRAVANSAPGDPPRCNSRQWDAVYPDGDFYKGGARGQGLYVSPGRDVVVGWFSTTMQRGWMNYARAAAKMLAPGD